VVTKEITRRGWLALVGIYALAVILPIAAAIVTTLLIVDNMRLS
jgi:hypothetical protein